MNLINSSTTRFSLLVISLLICAFINNSFAQSQPGGFDDEWVNYPAGEFGPMPITFDYTDVRSISQAPATGIHPRIFFGPDEIPEITSRLNTTTSGQEVVAQLHAYTTLLHLGYVAGGYNHNASYGSDAFGERRIGNAGKWDSHVYYYDLINNVPTALDGTDNKRKYLLASVMALEAFECLIKTGQNDPDTGLDYDDRAADLGMAMSNWAQLVLGDPLLNPDNYHFFGGPHMAMCYDLNYNAMTTNQQDSVRMALAEIIPIEIRYGAETFPYATTSNWCGLNGFELIGNLAIENEPGYNPQLTVDFMRAYRNFLTYGWYASGVPYEGMGKNYQMVANLVAGAKRGYSLLGHPHVKAYGQNFLPAIMQPYGHFFTGTDVWGGSGWDTEIGGYKFNANDVIGLKWAFPNDSKIDFVWRNFIEKQRDLSSTGYVYQHIEPATSGYHNYLLIAAIFADDYTDGDWETQNEATLENTSFLGPERGLGILRSGYHPDDLQVHFHCRQDLGGHTHGDRNNITLSGLGRIWLRYTYGSHFQETQYHSCILIDSLGIPLTYKDGVKARQPGTILDFSDDGNLAQVSGDATYAYSWEWHWEARPDGQDHSWLGTNNWEEVTETWNDFRSVPGTYDYFDLSFYNFGDWRDANKYERMIKRPYNPMERVYRTVGMVKGAADFVLVVDDVQKDDDPHNYKWLGQVANDLVVESVDVNLDFTDYRNDIILAEQNGDRKLLVRVLNNNGQCADSTYVGLATDGQTYTAGGHVVSDATINPADSVNFLAGNKVHLDNDFEATLGSRFYAGFEPCTAPPAFHETVEPGINGNSPITRLVVEADAVSPDFKIMLFPFVDGSPLPQTSWNSTKDILTVVANGETKCIAFPVVNGKTEIEMATCQ